MRALSGKLMAYGVFLIACGVAGYLSNPEKAKSALISGCVFGGLTLFWALLARQGTSWARPAALVTAILVAIATGWRAVIGWQGVAAGDSSKRLAAVLVTLMALASVVIIFSLKRAPAVEE